MSAPRTQAPSRDAVTVDGFQVDRAPVTNRRYAEFVEATGHRPPLYWPHGVWPQSMADHPVVGVDFFDALAFARWAGGALPSELEWCMATGLDEHRTYAWGDGFDSDKCNTVRAGLKGTSAVGSFPEGNAPSGCVDLCGNVWEMTCTGYEGDNGAIVVKGGSWYDFPAHARLDTQFRARFTKPGSTVGFRLIYGKPLRWPDHLDPELVEQCIAFRQGAAQNDKDETQDTVEFDSVLSALRVEAAQHLPGIDLEAPAHIEESEAALEWFEGVDLEEWIDASDALQIDDDSTKATRAVEWLLNVSDQVQTIVEQRPKTLLAMLAVAVLSVVGVALATGSDEPQRKVVAENRETEVEKPKRKRVRRTPKPPTVLRKSPNANKRKTTRNGATKAKKGSRLEQTIASLINGPGNKRDAAERWLIWNAARSYDRVKQALTARVSPTAKASLRYVLTAIEEDRNSVHGQPRVVSAPPQSGLVVFVDQMDATLDEQITKVRRTAKAENLEITIVLSGKTMSDFASGTKAATLRNVQLYVDTSGTLQKEWRVKRLPAVAGLKRDGEMGFLMLGSWRRANLAREVALLQR